MAERPRQIIDDTLNGVSIDGDPSLFSVAVQEDNKLTGREILTSSSRDRGNIAYPPSIHNPGNLEIYHDYNPWNETNETSNKRYQARVKRRSESSGSDEQCEESESYGSADAFVSSGSGKEMHHGERTMHHVERNVGQEEPMMKNLNFSNNGTFQDATGDDSQAPAGIDSLAISDRKDDAEFHLPVMGSGDVVRGEMATAEGESGSDRQLPEASARPMTPAEKKKVKYCEYEKRSMRLKSLDGNWPLSNPSAEDVANAGLFSKGQVYEGYPDYVFCYKCGQTLMNFQASDNPREEHDKFYPDCAKTKWY